MCQPLSGGMVPTSASPVLWSTSGGSLFGNVWTASELPGVYVIMARIDAAVNPDQDKSIVGMLQIKVKQDTTPPVITLNGANMIHHPLGTPYVDAYATVTDNVDSTIMNLIGVSTVNSEIPGVYAVTYQYTDQAGNVATVVTRTVDVVDTLAPSFVSLVFPVVNIEAIGVSTPYSFVPPEVIDNWGIASLVVDNPGPFGISATIVTWTATDFAGFMAVKTQDVIVSDNTIPTISAPVGIFVSAVDASGTPATAPAIATYLADGLASDGVDGLLTVSHNAPEIFPLGLTTVIFTATDAAGNTAMQSSTVTVQDNTPPVITSPASIIVSAIDAYGTLASDINIAVFLTGATALDNVDTGGNTGSATSTVSVQNVTAPIVTAPANITVAAVDATGVPATDLAISNLLTGATALDIDAC